MKLKHKIYSIIIIILMILATIISYFIKLFLQFDQSISLITQEENILLGNDITKCASLPVGILNSKIDDSKYNYHLFNSISELTAALQTKQIHCAYLPLKKYEQLKPEHYLKQQQILKESILFEDTIHLLISGLDRLGSAKKLGRSDMNMLASINLKRREVLLTAIPRDIYLRNTCMNNRFDKLTHTSNQGIACTISSLEQLLGITIHHYARISFSSVIEVINLIGGLELEVPFSFCEYNEQKQVIYINKGKQNLNGSQVLAFARHRYTLVNGDLGRNVHQQLILEALLAKTNDLRLLSLIDDFLVLMTKTVDTSFSKETIYQLLQEHFTNTKPYTIRSQSVIGKGNLLETASIPHLKVSVLEVSNKNLEMVCLRLKQMSEPLSLNSFQYSINISLTNTKVTRITQKCHLN